MAVTVRGDLADWTIPHYIKGTDQDPRRYAGVPLQIVGCDSEDTAEILRIQVEDPNGVTLTVYPDEILTLDEED